MLLKTKILRVIISQSLLFSLIIYIQIKMKNKSYIYYINANIFLNYNIFWNKYNNGYK